MRAQYEGVMRQADSVPADTAAAVKCDLAGEVCARSAAFVLRRRAGACFRRFGPGIRWWSSASVRIKSTSETSCWSGGTAGCALIALFPGQELPEIRIGSLKGDAMPAPDRPVIENELLGRVSYLIRAGKLVAVPAELSVVEQMVAKIVRRSVPAARALVYLHRMIQIPEKSAPEESALSVPGLATQVERYSVVIAIGGVPVRVNTTDADFLEMLQDRYAGFVSGEAHAEFDFDVELTVAGVRRSGGGCERYPPLRPVVDGARGFPRRVGSGGAPRLDSAVGESVFDRRRSAHRAYAGAGQAGRISFALRQRHSQRESVFVCRSLRSREDDDFTARSGGRHASYR